MKMRVKKFAGILFVTGLVAVSVCGCNGKIFKEIAGVETTNVENDADVNANDDTIEKQQSCTIDGVTIYVDKDWTACDGYDGTFEVIKEKEYFQFQAVTELGGYEPEEMYAALLEQYKSKYTIKQCSEELEKETLSDGTKVYLANVQMTGSKVLYSVDILIAPYENKVVSYSGQCYADAGFSFDLREITKTTVFHENQSESNATGINNENIVSGNSFVCSDDSEIQMKEDGSFIYYRTKGDYEGDYYTGSYEVYCGQEAVDKLVSMEEYGLTEEEMERYIIANQKGNYSDGEFYCIILHNETLYMDGETKEMENDTVYAGYYMEEQNSIDLINSATASPTTWTLQIKTF